MDLGRHARISATRGIVWEILRSEGSNSDQPFTVKEFYEEHANALEKSLRPLNPEASTISVVKGALQSLCRKGLVTAMRGSGDAIYKTSRYLPERDLRNYNYGRALIEAQRLHLL